MRTKTSKAGILTRTLLIIPLLAVMLYGFSNKEEVTKYSNEILSDSLNHTARSIDVEILENDKFLIDGTLADEKSFLGTLNRLHQDITPEIRNDIINIHVTSKREITNEEVWFIYNASFDYGFYRLVTDSQEIIKGKENTPFAFEPKKIVRVSKKEIEEYNKLAKRLNKATSGNMIVKVKEKEWLELIYSRMSDSQIKEAESMPDFTKVVKIPKRALQLQDKASLMEFQEYNRLAKKYNEMDRNDMRILKSDVDRLSYIYNKMSENQRRLAEPFPDLPEPPPAPDAPFYKNAVDKLKEELGEIPPPPPPPNSVNFKTGNGEDIEIIESPKTYDKGEVKTGFINIKGIPHYFVTIVDNTRYYNREGYEVNLNGVIISKSQVNAQDVVPGQYITKVYKDDKVVAEFKRTTPKLIQETPVPQKSPRTPISPRKPKRVYKFNSKDSPQAEDTKNKPGDLPPPLPPEPLSPMDHIISMAKKNADFFLEGKSISSDKAIDVLKKNKKLNVETRGANSDKPKVYITTKPIKIKQILQDKTILVNGRTPIDKMIALTKNELTRLKLEIEGSRITSFKLKIPGVKTQFIESNKLDENTKLFLSKVKNGDNVQLFDIKTGDNKKNAPIFIEVTE